MSVTRQEAIVIQTPGHAALVLDCAIPKLRDGYILVKTKAVALNPADCLHIDILVKEAGPLVGCDYAGVVEDIGLNVARSLRKGDRVCGITHGSNVLQHEDGAFAEFIVAKADLQMKIPDAVTFEEAATLGIGITTVAQGLYQSLGLAMPTNPVESSEAVLIYGGSTATAVLGIQFAKLSGYQVITTASPKHFEHLKSLGADACFDYLEPNCGKEIAEYTNNSLKFAWDTISTESSAKICAEALTDAAGAKYSCLLPVEFPRDDVASASTIAYSAFGALFKFGEHDFPSKPEDLTFAREFWQLAEELLRDGKFQVHTPRVGKGLEGILDGLELLRSKKVSGEKLVYTI